MILVVWHHIDFEVEKIITQTKSGLVLIEHLPESYIDL